MQEGKSDKGRGMINSFPDESDTDYDKAISESRKRMEKCSPCESVRELDALMSRLNMFHGTYYTKPCIEGYCVGFFAPHRPRIQRRVDAFKEERKVHEQDCHDSIREQEHREKQHAHQTQLEANYKIEELKVKSNQEIALAEIEAMKQSREIKHEEILGPIKRR